MSHKNQSQISDIQKNGKYLFNAP